MLHDDVRTLTATRILDGCGRLPSVVVGSPPCQDASLANTRGRGVDGERTGLFFEAVRLVREIRPAWCCFENVPGLRTRGADRVLSEMEAIGYACWPLVVGAVHAGAPHRRQRVWIVAADTDRCRLPEQPEPDCRTTTRIDRALWDDAIGCDVRADATGLERDERTGQNFSLPKPPGNARADAYGAGLAVGEGERSDPLEEPPPAIRAVAAWSGWNSGEGGLARSLRVADGISGWLADRGLPLRRRTLRSIQRAQIEAYGNAVVPQITEAIGRSMKTICSTDGTVLDLFAGGAGGWTLGMHRAGYRTIAACEIDPWRREAFARRWGECAG